jgi:hypothetical protein
MVYQKFNSHQSRQQSYGKGKPLVGLSGGKYQSRKVVEKFTSRDFDRRGREALTK